MKKILFIFLLFNICCKAQDSASASIHSINIGQSVTLSDVSNVGYSWNTGATTSAITVSPSTTTTYSLTTTRNGTSCSSTVTITVLPNTFDSISTNYFTRAAIVDSLERSAADVLVKGIKSAGFINKVVFLNIVSPTSYGAAINNLIGASPLDSGIAPNYSKNGFDFAGSLQFLNTKIHATSISPYSFTYLCRNRKSNALGIIMGDAVTGSGNTNYIFLSSTQDRLGAYSTTNLLNSSNTNKVGNFFFSVYNSSSREIRRNKTSLITSSAVVTGVQQNLEIWIGGQNANNILSVPALVEISTIGIFSPSLTITQQNALSDLLDTYNSTVIIGGR